jgi:hypothetical protein
MFLALLLAGTATRADAPTLVPVQGILTDADGVPLQGDTSMQFSIYDSQAAGAPLWSETQQLTITVGLFTAYLGAVVSLDLAHFRDHGELWLGIQVGTDVEMPRIRLGSTPYSGYAQYSSYSGGEGIVITPANIVSSVLGSSVEGDEIDDGTVTTDDIANGTILLEDLGQSGCQTGQHMEWDGSAWVCADPKTLGILSGELSNGDTIPLPAGFTQDQCHWFVSPRLMGSMNDLGVDRFACLADADRQVTCWYTFEGESGQWGCTVNYLIICQ